MAIRDLNLGPRIAILVRRALAEVCRGMRCLSASSYGRPME